MCIFFSTSGLICHWTTSAAGVPNSETHTFQFFCIHASIIILEDVVQSIVRSQTTKAEFEVWSTKWKLFPGIFWAIFFFYLTTPMLLYPVSTLLNAWHSFQQLWKIEGLIRKVQIARQIELPRDSFIPYSFYDNHVSPWLKSLEVD